MVDERNAKDSSRSGLVSNRTEIHRRRRFAVDCRVVFWAGAKRHIAQPRRPPDTHAVTGKVFYVDGNAGVSGTREIPPPKATRT